MKKRKETENGNTPGSEQPVTNDEAKSGIGDHRTLLGAQPSSWRELRTTKSPLCMNTAEAKHGAQLVKSLTQQLREKMILLNSECPC